MADVFISYSRANQEVVRRLAEAVRRHGYVVWWDDELPPHRSYSEVITEKIAGARAVIVVWSGGSIGSEWVRAEADLARNQKKLIQTSIDDCMPPMPFNQIQFASLADWDGGDDHPGWSKVKGSLAALCGAPTDVRPAFPLPDSPPPSTQPTQVTQIVTPPAPATARPAPRRSNLLLGGLIGGSIVVIAGVGVLALTRGRDAPSAPVVAQPPAGSGAPSTISGGNTQDAKPAAPVQQAAPVPVAPTRTTTAPQPARTTTTPTTPQRQTRREMTAMPTRQRRMERTGRMPIRRRRAY